jgi:hypothetical protein
MEKKKLLEASEHEAPEIDKEGYIATAHIEEIYEKTLIITLFAASRTGETLRVLKQFITKTDFIGLSFIGSEKGKWTKASLLYFAGQNRYQYGIKWNSYNGYVKCATEQDHDIINDFLERHQQDGINLIEEHQAVIRGRKRSHQLDITRRELDLVHNQAIDIPKEVINWATNESKRESAYIFFETIREKSYGVCSYCKQKVETNKVKHNDVGICPNCMTPVTFKGKNRAKYYDDKDHFAFIQKINQGLLIRRYGIKITYKHPGSNATFTAPKIETYECSRTKLEKYTTAYSEHYEFREFQKNEYRWCKEVQHYNYYGGGYSVGSEARRTYMRTYPHNIREITKGTRYENSGLEVFKGVANPSEYLTNKHVRLFEYMTRKGLHQLVEDLVNKESYNTKQLIKHEKNLGLSEYVLFMATKYNLGRDEIAAISDLESEFNIKLTLDQMKWVLLAGDFGSITAILANTTIQKMINYINKQIASDEYLKLIIGNKLRTWRDYLQMARSLSVDLTQSINVFPKDLQKRHDEVSAAIKIKNNKETNAGLKKAYKKFEWMNYKTKDFTIIVAKSIKDFEKESKVLGHCVGTSSSYAEGMAKLKRVILMLRKNKEIDKPWYTVELNPTTLEVIQKETKGRVHASPEADEFIKKWTAHLKKISANSGKITNIESRRKNNEHRVAN